ncbi:glycosyltransferase [Undibacterium cyanobacteriorum]|uniref:Glycosyltransferase n=1 Tax=Undibacterium cyanobacteriorum TaxID=3073561 RepID=A0ABY9RJG9_9BURK|nr:glycosyltransferase [Undibacterium sp. 20NA77.5]WMW81076.1 glycosyltransferase [Undibacterium sp. 20NA77.5]
MKPIAVHQFSFAVSSGSGVTNGMLYTQKLLQELGFESQLFASHIDPVLQSLVQPRESMVADPNALLLVHHCLGYDDTEWLFALPNPKLLVYHNITPPEWLPPDSEIGRCAVLGREQLRAWSTHFIGAIGDSKLNSDELRQNGYRNVQTIPMLVDFERFSKLDLPASVLNRWRGLSDSFNLLFVGRICENKNQLELIETVSHLKSFSDSTVRLVLAGDITSASYQARLVEEVEKRGLKENVIFTGKISEEELAALYRQCDVFVCLSEHEGFGMPLIEAMHFGLPVVARKSSSIGDTLGGAGYLLEAGVDAYHVAAAVRSLMLTHSARRIILQAQEKRLLDFEKSNIKRNLADYLRSVGVDRSHALQADDVAVLHDATSSESVWQIEGPYDSSYSLAIVNRELGKALSHQGRKVRMRSHEGNGDFAPSSAFLEQNEDMHAMSEQTASANPTRHYPDVAMRFCYPPLLNDMPAGLRVMHSYGWEETGFPPAFVHEFNRRADLVTVLSNTVAKVMRDNGVRVPIAVTGAGVDHIQQGEVLPLPQQIKEQLASFNFLHISSCFPRKGVDVLLAAYTQAFSSNDDVCLIIKTFPNPHQDVQADLDRLRLGRPDFPRVLVINEDWPQAQISALYRACDAFVAPSRGEGFGLPLAEAMLFELPVITTAWGGQTDFCNESTAWLCDFDFARAQTHLGLTHSLWAEPKQDHLAQLMWDLSRATSLEKQERVSAAKKLIETEFTWDRCAQKNIAAIERVRADLSVSRDSKIAWISTWNGRCGIANYSHYLTQSFPQNRLLVLANHIPERTSIDEAYVIRCWNSEQSEDFSVAFEHICDAKAEAVVIQYNFGFSSLPNLASFCRRLLDRQVRVYLFLHATADADIFGTMVSLASIKDLLAQLDGIFVHGIADVNRLREWGLVDNVVYFPHGVNETPNLSVVKHPQFQGTRTIASYGFLLPHKGVAELIQAFAALDHSQHDYRLLLVTSLYPHHISQDEFERCSDLISDFGLADKVKFITDYLPEEESLALLANADVIVFPYQGTQESSSAAVRVGIETGKPVLVSPLKIFDDVREAVQVMQGTDQHAILAALQAFFETDLGTSTKDVQAQNWFAERAWPRVSQRLLNIIDQTRLA